MTSVEYSQEIKSSCDYFVPFNFSIFHKKTMYSQSYFLLLTIQLIEGSIKIFLYHQPLFVHVLSLPLNPYSYSYFRLC